MRGKSVEADQEVEGDFKLNALISQLNDLTTEISEVENECKRQGRYLLPHKWKNSIKMRKIALSICFKSFSKKSPIKIECWTK